ncbi:hypothetical protein [Dokdonia sp.]|uniref:hypothetical protein n=1 Tax=Dokdonia sp. TaxID=2024995 RepID=UPI00326315E1
MKNTFSIIKTALLFITIVFLQSCDITKRAVKSKIETEKQTNTDTKVDKVNESKTITERKVEGGNIRTQIIPEKDRERDDTGAIKELVQEIKEGGLTKTVIYKQDGSVDVDCRLAEMFERIEQENVERDNSIITIVENLEEQIKSKDSEKTEKVNTSFIWAGMIGILLVFITALFLFYKLINKRFATIESRIA